MGIGFVVCMMLGVVVFCYFFVGCVDVGWLVVV